MNKTGTSSLHFAFIELGIESIHYTHPERRGYKSQNEGAQLIKKQILECKENGKKLLTYLDEYEAYSDIGQITHNFETLDRQYPGSKFIYTDRNTEDWLHSRYQHVQRNIKNVSLKLTSTNFTEVDLNKWKNQKEKHHRRVQRYFKNRPQDLLTINICEGDGYDKLCPFLGLKSMYRSFPRKNVKLSQAS